MQGRVTTDDRGREWVRLSANKRYFCEHGRGEEGSDAWCRRVPAVWKLMDHLYDEPGPCFLCEEHSPIRIRVVLSA